MSPLAGFVASGAVAGLSDAGSDLSTAGVVILLAGAGLASGSTSASSSATARG